jgi:hypothetical protein
MRAGIVAVVTGGLLVAACGGSAVVKPSPQGGGQGVFVVCTEYGTPHYAVVQAPDANCKELVAGRDFADGRVIIGVRPGTSDADVGAALSAYHATVISTMPSLGDRVLSVPSGSVPEAVVGLARYPFITFAAPDLLEHTTTSQQS